MDVPIVVEESERVSWKVDFAIWFVLVLLLIATVVAFFGLAPPFVLTSTKYSPRYSERKFQHVRIGQLEEQVRAALGEPLYYYTNDQGRAWMQYSHHDGGGIAFHFHSRMISVSNGIVVQKDSFINCD